MNIQYSIVGRKSTKKIYVRLYQNKLDISCSTDLIILEGDWDAENEHSKSDSNLNVVLANLKLEVLKAYNSSLSKGIVFSQSWLKNVIKTTFSRPIHEKNFVNEDYTIYFSDFAEYWMKQHAPKWKTSARKLMSKVLVSQYSKFIDDFRGYEATLPAKIMLKSFSQEDMYDYIDFLQNDKYAVSTISRNFLGRIYFFLNRAKAMKLEVSEGYNENIYLEDEQDEIDGVYLNEIEIKAIYDLDLSHDELLDNCRDSFVMSCYLGLRVGDFMTKLVTENIKDGFVTIKTQKTNALIKVPLHKYVKEILSKRFGQLPMKVNASEYNKQIKILGQLANIDNQVYGSLFDKDKQRKVKGYYKKYLLLSSHVARRSMATNLHGKVDGNVIMSCLGWSSSTMANYYNKTTKTEYAEQLKSHWENN